jgi:hypothetical protein
MSVDGEKTNINGKARPMPVVPAALHRPQFGVRDVMVLSVGVAAGLAGGRWIAPDHFAVIVGLVTLLGLLTVHVYPPRSQWGKLLWGTLVAAYVVAVGMALCRPMIR